MSASLNKVMLMGNVGNEPEVRTTPNGTKVAKLSLATNRKFKDRNQQVQEKVEWHRVTFWARLAEIVEQYVHKGDPIYVEGRLEYSQTEDAQGVTRYWTDIVAEEMKMLGSRGGNGNGGNAQYGNGRSNQRPANQPQMAGAGAPSGNGGFDPEDDDLPF